eukprot:Nk52_evm10s317 gene=Nk52_evmTU10s317
MKPKYETVKLGASKEGCTGGIRISASLSSIILLLVTLSLCFLYILPTVAAMQMANEVKKFHELEDLVKLWNQTTTTKGGGHVHGCSLLGEKHTHSRVTTKEHCNHKNGCCRISGNICAKCGGFSQLTQYGLIAIECAKARGYIHDTSTFEYFVEHVLPWMYSGDRELTLHKLNTVDIPESLQKNVGKSLHKIVKTLVKPIIAGEIESSINGGEILGEKFACVSLEIMMRSFGKRLETLVTECEKQTIQFSIYVPHPCMLTADDKKYSCKNDPLVKLGMAIDGINPNGDQMYNNVLEELVELDKESILSSNRKHFGFYAGHVIGGAILPDGTVVAFNPGDVGAFQWDNLKDFITSHTQNVPFYEEDMGLPMSSTDNWENNPKKFIFSSAMYFHCDDEKHDKELEYKMKEKYASVLQHVRKNHKGRAYGYFSFDENPLQLTYRCVDTNKACKK